MASSLSNLLRQGIPLWVALPIGLLPEPLPERNTPDVYRKHQLQSAYQSGPTTIRVLLPTTFAPSNTYRTLYILPVEAGHPQRFGDGLEEVRKRGLHDRYQLITIAPEFTAPPWFADHDTDPGKRDESFLLKDVIPLIDRGYPTKQGPQSRLLLGFSKSGWGAISLILRHPHLFHRVAAWDPGVRIDTGPMSRTDRQERIQSIFGNSKTFERYRLSNLIRWNADQLGNEARIFYYHCQGNRAAGGARLHQQMIGMGLPHHYLFEPERRHRWDSGWIPKAVRFLAEGTP